ncbi:hypothetical protein [Arthrobacter sp. UYEF36]|uniref:hypothetical protein n=1 Tax=Arthrobacter sp. UYEF36 TaxID=1756366 RepID=UPI0033993F56
MTAKLNVTVAVDLDAFSVTVGSAGTLTCENVRGLIAVVRRAERILPGFEVILDLSLLHAGSPAAFRALGECGARTLPPHPVYDRRPNSRGLTARRAA